jgi:hypothetical protein
MPAHLANIRKNFVDLFLWAFWITIAVSAMTAGFAVRNVAVTRLRPRGIPCLSGALIISVIIGHFLKSGPRMWDDPPEVYFWSLFSVLSFPWCYLALYFFGSVVALRTKR